ncbi:hypothetical protein ZP9_00003 [Shewanella phage ZP9]|nr:hypothetical protein ZP9_00003 [Shewanella phage ZP9]
MNQLITASQKTMDSLDLFVIVNDSREFAGESKVRLNDFHARVIDELEGEHYESFVVQNPNKTETICYRLTLDQCMLVAMRESKSVRKVVIAKMRELESQQTPKIPQTYAEALQLAADQARQLELAAPKVAFVDNLVEREGLMTATQVAQKHKKSAVWLNKFLDEVGVYNKSLKRSRAFQQWFIDKGYGEMKQTELGYSQALFSNAGEVWINEKLISEGAI